ncbi:hypothetical protein GGU11DRAFT_691260 [Lentinula aff. detonsa]|nr:hypothetical protein GGU11DRAFT_691260 [Lentinula aff. detonsa]
MEQSILLLIQRALVQQQPQTQSAPAPPTAPANPSPFVGPLSSNTAAGASSLLSLFPEVEAATITSIINHKFRASDLYKLDSRYRDKTERQILSLKGETLELTTNDAAYREYKSLNAIAVPLSTYFSILLTHAEAAGKVSLIASHFFKYNAHLIKITSEYEWSAVVGYHMAFFNKRRREMQNGDYFGWGKVDMELRGEHLYNAPRLSFPSNPSSKSSRKNPPSTPNKLEPCRKFDQGLCLTTPCPFGCPHVCKKCKLTIADGSHKCT